MRIVIATLFPDFFTSPLLSSMLKRAQESGAVRVEVVDIRQYSQDTHHVTDDRPFGGGPGMVMMVEPIDRALQAVQPVWPRENCKRVLTSPRGKVFTQAVAREYAALDELVIICGHYEGVDERVSEHLIDEEVSIGEFILTGGEPVALTLVDSVIRLLPGVLGNSASLQAESHDTPGFLSAPQYTRPSSYATWEVPAVLLSGNHAEITRWKKEKQHSK
jgi:tRNA (guanine37-N1)-methyltransferase